LKVFGHSLKNLGHSQKTLRPPGIPSWLRAGVQYRPTYDMESEMLQVREN